MSDEMFVLALTVGAGLLAIWVYARFPGLAPARMLKTGLHAGAALLHGIALRDGVLSTMFPTAGPEPSSRSPLEQV